MRKAPCKGCGKRTAKCHAECDDYREHSVERSEMREKEKAKNKAMYGTYINAEKAWLRKWRKDHK